MHRISWEILVGIGERYMGPQKRKKLAEMRLQVEDYRRHIEGSIAPDLKEYYQRLIDKLEEKIQAYKESPFANIRMVGKEVVK
jgi:hypothetical protein